jgi:hypothetical protein
MAQIQSVETGDARSATRIVLSGGGCPKLEPPRQADGGTTCYPCLAYISGHATKSIIRRRDPR